MAAPGAPASLEVVSPDGQFGHWEGDPSALPPGFRLATTQDRVAATYKAELEKRGDLAFGAGVLETVAGPLAAAIDPNPEQTRRIKELNPGAHALGVGTGLVGSLVAGKAVPTLPGLITEAGAGVEGAVAARAGTTLLGKAATSAARMGAEGALFGAQDVATRIVAKDPALDMESAAAEVGFGGLLGGALGGAGSLAVNTVGGLLRSGGEKALAFAASRAENPETAKVILSFKSDPVVKEGLFKLDRAGVSPDSLVAAHPETARLIISQADRVAALEAKYPGLGADVLAKATPEEAALILRDGDKIISGTLARNTINEELGQSVATALNDTTSAVKSALGARSAEVEALAAKADPAAAAKQYGSIFDRVTALSEKIKADSELYTPGTARRLEKLAEGLVRDASDDPVTIYQRLTRLRQSVDDIIPYGRELDGKAARDTVEELKGLRREIRGMLEDESVWGEAGKRTAEFNKAFSAFKNAEKIAVKGPKGDARQGFAALVEQPDGSMVFEARPARVNEWLNAMADARGGAKSENFKAYLDAASALADQMEKSGYEGAAALREQLGKIKAGFLDTEQKAGVTQIVNRLKNPDAILTSKGYIPTPKQIAGQAAESLVGSIPVVGHVYTGLEGVITKTQSPSFLIGVSEAFGKATAKLGAAMDSGIGRVFSTTTARGAAEAAEVAVTPKNYQGFADSVRSHANDPVKLADAVSRESQGWRDYAPDHDRELQGIAARAANLVASKLPTEPPPSAFGGAYVPPKAALAPVNRTLQVINRPASIMDEMARGTLHSDHIEALATVYPAIHKEMTIKTMDYLAKAMARGERVPFPTRMGLAMFLGGSVDPLLSPQSVAANQLAIAMAPKENEPGITPGPRSLEHLNIAGRMATPQQASAQRGAV